MHRSDPRPALVVGLATVEILAIAFWAGGLGVLGAIVAPTIFGVVPAPTSADAMTLVFRRFDRVAMACAAVALLGEASLALRSGKPSRTDAVRVAIVALAAALAIGQGVWLSPAIEALHREGTIRGQGPAGVELDRTHRIAEAGGKGQLALLVASLVLISGKIARAARPTR